MTVLRHFPNSFLSMLVFFLVNHVALGHPGVDHDIEKATKELAENPDSIDLLVKRGTLYRLDHQWKKSLADLNRVRRLDPNNPFEAFQRGMTFSAMQQDQGAEKAFSRYLGMKLDLPQRARAYAERANVRTRGNRYKEAIVDYTASLQITDDVEYYLLRGGIQEKLGLLDDAVAGYRRGFTQLQKPILLRLALIRVETARERYDEALKLIDQPIKHAQVKTEWYLRRAAVLSFSGRTEQAHKSRHQALDEVNRVLVKRPSAIQLYVRAKVYRSLKQLTRAKEDLALAIKKSPRYQPPQELLKKLNREINSRSRLVVPPEGKSLGKEATSPTEEKPTSK